MKRDQSTLAVYVRKELLNKTRLQTPYMHYMRIGRRVVELERKVNLGALRVRGKAVFQRVASPHYTRQAHAVATFPCARGTEREIAPPQGAVSLACGSIETLSLVEQRWHRKRS